MPELLELLHAAAGNITLAAIILSSGLLVIATTREAFEHDPPVQVPGLMGAAAVTMIKWKYVDNDAESARRTLYAAAALLRVGIRVIVIFVFVCLVAAWMTGFLREQSVGTGRWAEWAKMTYEMWIGWADHKLLAAQLFEGGVLLLGSAMIVLLSEVVRRVVRFRRAYGKMS